MAAGLAPSASRRSPQRSEERNRTRVNVSTPERVLSAVGGGALVLYGLRRSGWQQAALAAVGSALVHRGVTGQCMAYRTMGISTAAGRLRAADATVDESRASHVRQSVTINRPREELYQFWRNFENLPRFMNHLERVSVLSDRRSHFAA